jgi:hypothetical protein
MIERVPVKCPNPKCRNGRVPDYVGFAVFSDPCPTCGGNGFVMVTRTVPDVTTEHQASIS